MQCLFTNKINLQHRSYDTLKIERTHLSNCVLFYDTPCIASFLVRSFTIYFNVKCIIRVKTGHLSKSPTINIPLKKFIGEAINKKKKVSSQRQVIEAAPTHHWASFSYYHHFSITSPKLRTFN